MPDSALVALALTLAWLAGIRVYLTVLALGLATRFGAVELPPLLEVCGSPWVLGTAALLTVVEFSADKIPGVDSFWDLLQTLVRIPAGALLAAGAATPEGMELSGLWLGIGAGSALASHGLKLGTRLLVNASPEPVSNWLSSGSEDVAALGSLLVVLSNPWLALLIAVAIPLSLALLLWWMIRRWLRARRSAALAGGR